MELMKGDEMEYWILEWEMMVFWAYYTVGTSSLQRCHHNVIDECDGKSPVENKSIFISSTSFSQNNQYDITNIQKDKFEKKRKEKNPKSSIKDK